VPADAMTIAETITGAGGNPLSLAMIAPADNARFTVDQLAFTRTSNTTADAIPGATLTLNGQTSGGPETLLLDTDSAATQRNLQNFVTAYNNVMQAVQSQLAVTPATNRTATLAGDPAIRALQQDLGSLVMNPVGTGPVSTLADLGIKTERDGSLTLDATKLERAMALDPAAVNDLFQNATTGMSKTVDSLVKQYTDPTIGMLTVDKLEAGKTVSRMDDQISSLQLRVDQYHDTLVQQFTAMETVVSQMKAIGSFLTSQFNPPAKS
jgi:flagellar hook-associated protein 2